jgi:hypothetical protein
MAERIREKIRHGGNKQNPRFHQLVINTKTSKMLIEESKKFRQFVITRTVYDKLFSCALVLFKNSGV